MNDRQLLGLFERAERVSYFGRTPKQILRKMKSRRQESQKTLLNGHVCWLSNYYYSLSSSLYTNLTIWKGLLQIFLSAVFSCLFKGRKIFKNSGFSQALLFSEIFQFETRSKIFQASLHYFCDCLKCIHNHIDIYFFLVSSSVLNFHILIGFSGIVISIHHLL